jgi:hypothetical protein
MKSLIGMALCVGSLGISAWMTTGCSSSSSPPAENYTPDTGTRKDAATDTSQEDQETDDASEGGNGACADASGVLPSDCASCLASKCSMDLSACSCDPTCVTAVQCYNSCSEDGGTGLSCEVSCSTNMMVGVDSGLETAATLLNCATTTCASVCEAPSGDGGSDGGTDAGG